jgi:predicted NAD-dependent protein-ADP-ribosyltransferase YbiA (DUF1768 family)
VKNLVFGPLMVYLLLLLLLCFFAFYRNHSDTFLVLYFIGEFNSIEAIYQAFKYVYGTPSNELWKKFTSGAQEGYGRDGMSAKRAGSRKGMNSSKIKLETKVWFKVRDAVMRLGVYARSLVDDSYRHSLIDCVKNQLYWMHFERCSANKPKYWGGCFDANTKQWRGRNRLGEIMYEMGQRIIHDRIFGALPSGPSSSSIRKEIEAAIQESNKKPERVPHPLSTPIFLNFSSASHQTRPMKTKEPLSTEPKPSSEPKTKTTTTVMTDSEMNSNQSETAATSGNLREGKESVEEEEYPEKILLDIDIQNFKIFCGKYLYTFDGFITFVHHFTESCFNCFLV